MARTRNDQLYNGRRRLRLRSGAMAFLRIVLCSSTADMSRPGWRSRL